VRTALARRGGGVETGVDRVLALDSQWRSATSAAETLRAAQRQISETVAAGKRTGADVSAELAQVKEMSEQGKALTQQAEAARKALDAELEQLPNLPAPGAAPADTVIREVGEAGRTGRDHLELAGPLIDMEAGARLSGSRFAYLRGDLVLTEFALVRWALGRLGEHGFVPVIPPVLVREEALYGTGFLPDTEQQIYRLADDDLYLVGTSEVALASLHAGEAIDETSLPLRYAGFSTCFRREAGAAGRDTRGIFRVHQFDKLEMFVFTTPDRSTEEHERILAIEEQLLTELAIPYRVVNISVDDLGPSAAIKYDCEAWLPGQARYRELTSCSNTTDFQARRLKIRMRPQAGGSLQTLHTLNGTAVAVGRTLIALLENGQDEAGVVSLPQCLVDHGAPAQLSLG
jgi:seryl-tRNA synthetase